MKQQLLIGVAAVLALSAPAFAQPAGAPAAPPTGAAPATTTGVVGITPPGVAGGVQPYRPAGAPAINPSAGGLPTLGGPLPSATGPSGSYVTNSINTTLQAGQVPGGDSATVGGASAGGPGLRTPNPSTGVYNGGAGPTYGAPGATPYTGPGSVSLPPSAAPYTGPGVQPGAAAGGSGGLSGVSSGR